MLRFFRADNATSRERLPETDGEPKAARKPRTARLHPGAGPAAARPGMGSSEAVPEVTVRTDVGLEAPVSVLSGSVCAPALRTPSASERPCCSGPTPPSRKQVSFDSLSGFDCSASSSPAPQLYHVFRTEPQVWKSKALRPINTRSAPTTDRHVSRSSGNEQDNRQGPCSHRLFRDLAGVTGHKLTTENKKPDGNKSY